MIETHSHIHTTVMDFKKLEQKTFVNLIQLVSSNSCTHSIIVYKTQSKLIRRMTLLLLHYLMQKVHNLVFILYEVITYKMYN